MYYLFLLSSTYDGQEHMPVIFYHFKLRTLVGIEPLPTRMNSGKSFMRLFESIESMWLLLC